MTILENVEIKYLQWSLFSSEAYSFIIKWTQSQIFSKILIQMNNCTKPSLACMVFTKFDWFWLVLGANGYFWLVLGGLGSFGWFWLVACFITKGSQVFSQSLF